MRLALTIIPEAEKATCTRCPKMLTYYFNEYSSKYMKMDACEEPLLDGEKGEMLVRH